MSAFVPTLIQFGSIGGMAAYKVAALLMATAAACASLGMLQWKVRRRRQDMEDQMAGSLTSALRSGALDFQVESAATRCNIFWVDPDESEASEPQLMPSRRRLLGYPTRPVALLEAPEPVPEPIVRVRVLGPPTVSPDEDLLLGVPKALLRPHAVDEKSHDAVPEPSVKPLALPWNLHCDCPGHEKLTSVGAEFAARFSMAVLKAVPAPILIGLPPAPIISQRPPRPEGRHAPQQESAHWSASAPALPADRNKPASSGLLIRGFWPEELRLRLVPKPAVRVEALPLTGAVMSIQTTCPLPFVAELPLGMTMLAATVVEKRADAQPRTEPFICNAPPLRLELIAEGALVRDLPVAAVALLPPARRSQREAWPQAEPFIFNLRPAVPRSRLRPMGAEAASASNFRLLRGGGLPVLRHCRFLRH